MGGTLAFDWTNTETMLQAMVDVGQQASDLDTYFNEHVVNTTGIDYPSCALKPIGDQMEPLGEAFTWMRKRYQRRWVGVIRSVALSAKEVDQTDSGINLDFGRYMGDLGKIQGLPDFDLNLKFFDVESLEDDLQPPGEGGPTMKHDPGWEIASEGYDATRDGINEAIDVINKLGVDLPKLPEKSLEEYIIYPLSGNYRLLQGNAEACRTTATGFTSWAKNFGRLSGQVQLAITGRAADKLSLHLLLYGAVMGAVGEGIDKGSTVFDYIATMSEKISVRVEKALVKLTTKLSKLATKLSSKLSPLGWLWFAKDVIEKGWEAVTDIYDDIMACKEIIQACFGLAEEIKAWAQVMADSLKTMKQIKDMVEQLPRVDSGGGLPALPKVDLPKVEKDLGEIEIELDDDSDEEQDLEDRLDDLEADAEDDDEDQSEARTPDDDDGEMLMAPGPFESPYGEPQPQYPTA